MNTVINFSDDEGRAWEATVLLFGPTLQVETFDGEWWGCLAIGADQSGRANAVLSSWSVDGPIDVVHVEGSCEDVGRFWDGFMELLPAGLAPALGPFRGHFIGG
jgi:hypothetical protein